MMQSKTSSPPPKRVHQHRPINHGARRLAARYNMIVNLSWTILHVLPVTYYCITQVPSLYVYIVLAISLLAGFLPKWFFNKIQLGQTTKRYKKIGVLFIRKFSQDGDIINKQIRKKYRGYTVTNEKSSINKYIGTTYFYERFHLIGLVFMLCVFVYAFMQADYLWAIVILINNILYNLYPMLLQQYNRIRIMQIDRRTKYEIRDTK